MDGYVLSRKARVCVGIELTCPMEENIEKWHTAKWEKYQELVTEATSNRWTFHLMVLEVGARGWISPGFTSNMMKLGFDSQEVLMLSRRLRMLARKCSYVIWINRFNRNFEPWRLAEATEMRLEVDRKHTKPTSGLAARNAEVGGGWIARSPQAGVSDRPHDSLRHQVLESGGASRLERLPRRNKYEWRKSEGSSFSASAGFSNAPPSPLGQERKARWIPVTASNVEDSKSLIKSLIRSEFKRKTKCRADIKSLIKSLIKSEREIPSEIKGSSSGSALERNEAAGNDMPLFTKNKTPNRKSVWTAYYWMISLRKLSI